MDEVTATLRREITRLTAERDAAVAELARLKSLKHPSGRPVVPSWAVEGRAPPVDETRGRLLAHLRDVGEASIPALAAALDVSTRQLRRHVAELVESKVLEVITGAHAHAHHVYKVR